MESALLFFALIIALIFGWGMFGGILQLILALILWMFIGNIAGHLIRGEDYGVAGNIALGLVGGIFVFTALNRAWFCTQYLDFRANAEWYNRCRCSSVSHTLDN